MKIKELIFGRWVQEYSHKAVLTTSSVFGSFENEVIIVLERNERTGERRAYAEYLSGFRRNISVRYVDLLTQGNNNG